MIHIPAELIEYASRQFGLVTRPQALESLSATAFYRRVASGVLIQVGWGVYRLAGSPPSWRQRAMAACLCVRGEVAVSHLAAAYLWKVACVAAPKVQLTVPHNRRVVRVHPPPYRLPLPAMDITQRWAIPTTTPARTVIDLSRLIERPLLERIVDDLVRSRHLKVEAVAERLSAAEALPRHRADVLGQIVALRLGRGVGISPREDWAVDALLAAELPLPERNVIVEVDGRLYELDLAYPELKIGIEYDGWEVHGDNRHFHADREKLAALQLDGWIIFPVTSTWTAELLVERVAAALARRRRLWSPDDAGSGMLAW